MNTIYLIWSYLDELKINANDYYYYYCLALNKMNAA